MIFKGYFQVKQYIDNISPIISINSQTEVWRIIGRGQQVDGAPVSLMGHPQTLHYSLRT